MQCTLRPRTRTPIVEHPPVRSTQLRDHRRHLRKKYQRRFRPVCSTSGQHDAAAAPDPAEGTAIGTPCAKSLIDGAAMGGQDAVDRDVAVEDVDRLYGHCEGAMVSPLAGNSEVC